MIMQSLVLPATIESDFEKAQKNNRLAKKETWRMLELGDNKKTTQGENFELKKAVKKLNNRRG